MFKKLLSICFIFAFALVSKGTHIIGGYLHYEKVGADTYEVSVTVYKDCQSYINGSGGVTTPIEFDNINGQPPMFLGMPDAVLTVYSYVNGSLDSTGYYFTDVVITDVNIEDPDSCRNVPDEVCVQKGVYTITLSLPDHTDDGYYLSYQRCCRNPSSINVDVDPLGTGISIAGFIPKLENVPENSNPNYSSNPPIAFCLFHPVEYDLSAYDDDGDSLAYEFATPLDGANFGSVNGVIPPPYGLISYNSGYSSTYPITSTPPFALDPVTGLLTGTPIQLGAYVVGVKVLEYRNSVLISETIRDLRFYVLDCGEVFAEFETEDHICDGIDTIEFISYSSDVNSYLWDFGDLSTTDDSSSLPHPSYGYANNGQYTVYLTTNEGTTCQDIDTHIVNFRNTIDVEIEQVNMQCLDGNSFNFSVLSYDFPTGTTLDWDFGSDASQHSGSGFNVNGVSYSNHGTYDVTLTATYNFCVATSTIQVGIYPEMFIDIPDILIGCIDEEFTVEPNVITPGYTYSWYLGGIHISDKSTFQMMVDSTTVLDLALTVTDNYGCTRTINKAQWLHIKDQSIAEFTVSDTVVFVGDEIEISNYATKYTSLVYHFGNGDSTLEENPIYAYNEEGIYTISQVVDNGGNCPDYYNKTIEVRYDHYIYYPNVFTPNGDNLNDTFFPVREGVKTYSLEIYDRWGKKVYNGAIQKEFHEWNGIYESGIEGAQEVYNYFCTYVTEKEEVYSLEGVVLLLK